MTSKVIMSTMCFKRLYEQVNAQYKPHKTTKRATKKKSTYFDDTSNNPRITAVFSERR